MVTSIGKIVLELATREAGTKFHGAIRPIQARLKLFIRERGGVEINGHWILVDFVKSVRGFFPYMLCPKCARRCKFLHFGHGVDDIPKCRICMGRAKPGLARMLDRFLRHPDNPLYAKQITKLLKSKRISLSLTKPKNKV